MAFFDVQNLFRHAKDAFGHYHPNFDPVQLHRAVCQANGWLPIETRFYTGVPDANRDPKWASYWSNRVLALKRSGVQVTTRKLRYRDELVSGGNPDQRIVTTPQEKGIDVRLALDLVKMARRQSYDVAILFSQDQDLAEVVDEITEIATEQDRQIEICCAFPDGGDATSRRGVNRTKWFRMDRAFYDACLDARDYRPK